MTSKEALENITDWIEYFTRLDYVEPIVRGEVQKNFYEAYHKTRPELELIQKDLEILEILKKWILESAFDYTNEKHPKYLIDTFIFESEPIFNIIKEWLDDKH